MSTIKNNIDKKIKKTISSNDNNIISINNNKSLIKDKEVNDILENIGKKSKNVSKKEIINNFIKKNKSDDLENEIENKKTFTENLSKEEINEKLEDYKLVDDISKVQLGTHLRYFINKDGVKLFRMGGNLKRNFDLPNFIFLENAKGVQWSVQIENTIFYKKMTLKEIKEEYELIISELHEKIKKLKSKIKELEK